MSCAVGHITTIEEEDMITLYPKLPKPSLVKDRAPTNVTATLQIANGQGLIKYNALVTCDLVAGDGDKWVLNGTMKASYATDQKMVGELKPDKIVCQNYGLGQNVGEDFDQKYTR